MNHVKTYNVFRSNVMFQFGFLVDSTKPRVFVKGFKKNGTSGNVDKESALQIALSPEEIYELIHCVKTESKLEITHDTNKASGGKDRDMKFLRGDVYKGKYYLSLSAGEDKRIISLSPGEIRVIERLVDIWLAESFVILDSKQ